MEAPDETLLSMGQLKLLEGAFHLGAADASEAFSKWTGKASSIAFEAIEQVPLHRATVFLGEAGIPICCCAMEMTGELTGYLIFAFDTASGLALADLLLGQTVGASQTWGEMEHSAALETTNILGCAFLNSLAKAIPAGSGILFELIPKPPIFCEDFPESLLEFVLMDQAAVSDQALVAKSEFQIEGTPVDWTMLFVPDAESMRQLRSMLSKSQSNREGE